MRKDFCCIIMAMLVSLLFTACTERKKNETIESVEIVETVQYQNDNLVETNVATEDCNEEQAEKNAFDIGFSGGVLDDSNVSIESDEKETVIIDEKQDSDVSVETNEDTTENVTEENENVGPIRDNTYDGDLLEPPEASSDGVL